MNKSTQVRKSPDFINKQFIKFIWFVHNQTLNQRAFMSGLTSKLFLKFEWSRAPLTFTFDFLQKW